MLKPLIDLILEKAPPPAKPWPWYGDDDQYEVEEEEGPEITNDSYINELYNESETAFFNDPFGEIINPQDDD